MKEHQRNLVNHWTTYVQVSVI